MARGSIIAQGVPQCRRCGRILEADEICDCAQRLPRDGLRACCPEFKARSTYQGHNYINCTGRKLRFESRAERDSYYMEHCCAKDAAGCRARGPKEESHA